MRPTAITADKKRGALLVTWDDGHITTLPFQLLSEMCPCATCSAERNNPDPLKVIRSRSSELEAIVPVGNYAINLTWKGGCRFGIYTWDYLLDLERRFLQMGGAQG
ncbi:MAG: gamma-butyrobetaine hydroxylase-like domain-containing protein [Thermoflexales bacterium]